MKRHVLLAVAVGVLASLVAATTFGKMAQPANKAPATKPETYAVVQIGDETKVIPKSQVTGEKKRVADENAHEAQAYKDAKKAAAKNKDKSEIAKPVKRTFKVLKSALKSEQEANDWLDKHLKDKGDGAAKKTAGQ